VYTRKEQTITAARWFFFFRRLFENCKEKQIKTIAIFLFNRANLLSGNKNGTRKGGRKRKK
jgi:hypothetical protein